MARAARFPAKYPGKCLCGADFKVGDRIFWDGGTRRATLCPACEAPKLRPGTWVELGRFHYRFDRDAAGHVRAMVVTTADSGHGAFEVYRLGADGQWAPAEFGREMVFVRCLTHDEVEGVRTRAGVSMEPPPKPSNREPDETAHFRCVS